MAGQRAGAKTVYTVHKTQQYPQMRRAGNAHATAVVLVRVGLLEVLAAGRLRGCLALAVAKMGTLV